MNRQFPQSIETKEVEFSKTYIAQCRNCEKLLFELSAVSQMARWNQQRLLLLRDSMIPSALKESAGKMAPRNGPYAMNVFTQLNCKCGSIVGLHVVTSYWACQIFTGKFLVEAEKLRVVLIEASVFTEVGLLDEFESADFVKYEAADPSSLQAEEDNEKNLKRNPKNKRREQLSHQQIKSLMSYFSKVLGDMEQRISDLESSCTTCINVVQRLAKKLPEVPISSQEPQS